MGAQTVPDLKEMFRQAAEIAAQLPESMQVAGFNRAVDLLSAAMGIISGEPEGAEVKKRALRPAQKRGAGDGEAPKNKSSAELIDAIDSTRHPGVRSAAKVLDRALMILQIALREHGVDGLYPSDISRVLTDKFRLGTNDAAVRMSLGSATNLVNRVKVGKGYVYKIMGPGEDYLAHLGETGAAPNLSRASGKRRKAKKDDGAGESRVRPNAGAKTTGTKAVGRVKPNTKGALGPKTAIVSLVEAGYFDVGRTGPDVQGYLRTKRGYSLPTAQLRLAMLRLVRDGLLERNTNGDGHYEYKKP